jgi:phospho-N-acetylmuramoyl-pentapeptide-transferase
MFPILKLLKRLKSRQTISEFVPEHKAKQGTPTMGGLIVLSGTLVALGCAAIDGSKGVVEYAIVLLAFAILGFVDDFLVPRIIVESRGLGWKQKILLEIGIAVLVLVAFERVHPLSAAVAVIVILFFANAYNFTDGLDALAGTVGIALLAGLGALAWLKTGSQDFSAISIVAFAICGGLIAFLFLNAPPARVFMGDVGSLPIGAAMGLMIWQLGFRGGVQPVEGASLSILSLIMFVELIPVPLQIASVKLRGKGKKIFLKTPIHHAFQERGIPETRIVAAYCLCQVLATALALTIYVVSINHSVSYSMVR